MPFRDDQTRWLPCLIYLAFMTPQSWVHWTGLGILLLLMRNREEWNFYLIPGILFAILPSLYMAQITWSLVFAVLLSYPLLFKAAWPKGPSVLWISAFCLALLAFFAGPLAPLVLILAFFIFLPRKLSLPLTLIFVILLALPLGRSDWQTWLGKSGSTGVVPPILLPVSPGDHAPLPPQSQQPLAPPFPMQNFLEGLYQSMLFAMFALLLTAMLRFLYLMRKQTKSFRNALFIILALLGGAAALIPFIGFVGRWLSARTPTHDLPVLPGGVAPGQTPVPQVPDPVVPEPLIPDNGAPLLDDFISRTSSLSSSMAYVLSILLLIGVCAVILLFLKKYWSLPSLQSQVSPEASNVVHLDTSSSSYRTDLTGAAMLLHGYEYLRQHYLTAYESLTPLELCKHISLSAFHELTQAYVALCYAKERYILKDRTVQQWIEDTIQHLS